MMKKIYKTRKYQLRYVVNEFRRIFLPDKSNSPKSLYGLAGVLVREFPFEVVRDALSASVRNTPYNHIYQACRTEFSRWVERKAAKVKKEMAEVGAEVIPVLDGRVGFLSAVPKIEPVWVYVLRERYHFLSKKWAKTRNPDDGVELRNVIAKMEYYGVMP